MKYGEVKQMWVKCEKPIYCLSYLVAVQSPKKMQKAFFKCCPPDAMVSGGNGNANLLAT